MKGSDTEHLLRYADLVEDMPAFLEAAARPLPRVVWPNPLKADPQEITELILVRCPRARPLSWPPGACLVPAEENPGKWPEFHLGLIHCQEEVTLYPVFAMAPRPGEAILDMCRGNGLHIPGEERFDRVLLDAPCTGEGTSRKSQGWIRHQKNGDWNKLSGLQRGLLWRALNLTRPGGLLIYCTCTFAPEENEWVLSGIYESVARMEPLELPEGVRTTPGVTDWKGMRFRADVVHASRFWPHQNNTGGFFLAALRKL